MKKTGETGFPGSKPIEYSSMHLRTIHVAAFVLAISALALALCSCAATEKQAEPELSALQKAELAARFHALLKEKCWSCHGEPGKKVRGLDGTLSYILDYDKLVEKELLTPGDLESKLYSQVESGAMPLEYDPATRKMYEKKLPPESIELTLSWMKAGSPRWDPNAKVIVPPAKLAWSELKQAAPPPRAGTAMAEGPNDSVVLFGGVGENGALNDTWVFSGGVWTEAKPKSPPGVLGAALMVFDAKRQVSVLVGIDMSTHEWDGTEWREVKTPAAPPMRQEFSLAYDVRNQVVTLFGGLDPASRKYFNDVWTYDGAAWKQLDMKSTPMARHGAAMAWSPANGALLLFGGRNYYGRYVDTWLFDGKTWTMQTPADSPAACENMLMAASATAAVMVCSAPADDNSATWQWTGKNWLKGPDLPKSRAQGGIAFDKAAKAIIVLGGACGTGPLHDCWALSDVR